MESRFDVRVPALALALLAAISAACSGGPTGNPPTASDTLKLASASSDLSAALSAASPVVPPTPDAASATGPSASSFVVAIKTQPWAECLIYPEGAANDRVHTTTVAADGDGELRFFAPSSDWGTRLTLQCSLRGTSQPAAHVDLNDSSTFTRIHQSDLAPQLMGVRQPLTGDLSSMSNDDALARGYPPRPDPTTAPQKYARWAQRVAKPVQIFKPVPVALLGATFTTGPDEGNVSNSQNGWTGFVQTGSGFGQAGVANYGTFYDMYYGDTLYPDNLGCQSGALCMTGIWAGIGGYPSQFFSTLTGDLFQSGFVLLGGGGAFNFPPPFSGPGTYLFFEFTPPGTNFAPSIAFPPSNPTTGDEIGLWGWAAGSSSCGLNSNGAFACFAFEDYTAGWGFSATPQQQPTNGTWFPTTVDYIVESPAEGQGFSNTDYFFDIMDGAGWDINGNYHGDPSGSSDPYVYVQAAQNPSVAEWDTGNTTAPEDPMFFIWQHY